MASGFGLGQGSSMGLPVTQNGATEGGLDPLHSQQGFVGPLLTAKAGMPGQALAPSSALARRPHTSGGYTNQGLYVMGN